MLWLITQTSEIKPIFGSPYILGRHPQSKTRKGSKKEQTNKQTVEQSASASLQPRSRDHARQHFQTLNEAPLKPSSPQSRTSPATQHPCQLPQHQPQPRGAPPRAEPPRKTIPPYLNTPSNPFPKTTTAAAATAVLLNQAKNCLDAFATTKLRPSGPSADADAEV